MMFTLQGKCNMFFYPRLTSNRCGKTMVSLGKKRLQMVRFPHLCYFNLLYITLSYRDLQGNVFVHNIQQSLETYFFTSA